MLRLVVIDDDVDVAALTAIRLRKAGFVVDAFHSGYEGLDFVRSTVPDLVVIDWMMPGFDGIDVAGAIRMNPVTAGIPLVMITVKAAPNDIDDALAAGYTAVLTKPYVTSELVDRIRSILGVTA